MSLKTNQCAINIKKQRFYFMIHTQISFPWFKVNVAPLPRTVMSIIVFLQRYDY